MESKLKLKQHPEEPSEKASRMHITKTRMCVFRILYNFDYYVLQAELAVETT